MPAATTHVEMAKDVLRTAPYLETLITDKQMFYLGSQGPDLLFFNRASILPGSTKKYGNLMHVEKVPEVIAYFQRYARKSEKLNSYFLGYLCHYCLDSTVHPLVYGVAHAKHAETGIHEGEIHVELESEIDVWLLSQRGRSVSSYDVYQYLKIDTQGRKELAEMYHNMFIDIFHISISEKHLLQAIKDVPFYTRVLAPGKWKQKFIYSLENAVMKGSHAITAMMLYGTQINDVINLDHKSYTLPWDENETIQDSFPQLYGRAVLKAQKMLLDPSDFHFTKNFCGTDKPFEG